MKTNLECVKALGMHSFIDGFFICLHSLSLEMMLGNKLTVDDSGKDDLLTIQFGIINDRRNNPRQPTSGSLLRFGVEQSIPVGSGEIGLNRLRGNFSYFIPVNFTGFSEGPEAVAFNIQAGHIIGDLPPYEAFPLGGTNTVRGYDEG